MKAGEKQMNSFFPTFLFLLVVPGRREIKGEVTHTLPNVPILRDGEPTFGINSGSQYGECSEGFPQLVRIVIRCC